MHIVADEQQARRARESRVRREDRIFLKPRAPVRKGMKPEQVPLILPNRTHALRMLIERALSAHGRGITVAAQVDGHTMTKALVLAGSATRSRR